MNMIRILGGVERRMTKLEIVSRKDRETRHVRVSRVDSTISTRLPSRRYVYGHLTPTNDTWDVPETVFVC